METTTLEITDRPFYKYSANFNPSILQLDDGRYLMSFRSFRRTTITESRELGAEINHPWMGGPEDINWWQTFAGGFTGTGFLLLNSDLTIQKVLNKRIKGGVDMRLSLWQGKSWVPTISLFLILK
jgi:hypothetical protein